MRQRTKRKIKATAVTVLKVLDKSLGWMLVPSKSESLRRLYKLQYEGIMDTFWKEYYVSSVRDEVGRLKRKGLVEVRTNGDEIEVKIKSDGRTELLRYKLRELKLNEGQKWDKKWRLVLFDVVEVERGRRDELRRWLARLGLRQLQKSVWISPWPLEKEVAFLREVLGIPHGVKLITAEKIENDSELRELFDL